MSITPIAIGSYNPATLINNPPYITNNPFYEYMRDNKLDFDSTDLRMTRAAIKNPNDSDKYMTGLFTATAGVVCVAGYIARNKLKRGWRILSDGARRVFHR